MSKSQWEHLEPSVKIPDYAKEVKGEGYREILATVLAENKLWFFGLKGVDPTSYENWHETILLGSFVSTYDLATKQWKVEDLPVIDPDKNKRDYLFTVGGKIFLFVYTKTGTLPKLLQWRDGGFKEEVKIDIGVCCDSKKRTTDHYEFIDTPDGFYSIFESDEIGYVAKLTVEMDPNGKNAKSAKITTLAKVDLKKHYRIHGHLTCAAYCDNNKLFVWGGEEGCGFLWQPNSPFLVEVDNKTLVLADKKVQVPDPVPPFGGSGPQHTLMESKHWVMLGGSRGGGPSGQITDDKTVWLFDTGSKTFKKSALELPQDLKLYRMSFGYNRQTGDLYVCDREKGIYKTNLKTFL